MAFPKITPVTGPAAVPLLQPWTCCARPAGTITHPEQLADVADWLPAKVPGTAAAAMRAQGWSFDTPHDFDAEDWWFRTSFAGCEPPCRISFDGLATLAEVWLNGQKLLSTDNMFRRYVVRADETLRDRNELVLGFRSVTEELNKKRPRPRWKTKLVQHQQLRWLRASLLGRMPGWSPPVASVGPWREVRVDTLPISVVDWQLRSDTHEQDAVVRLSGMLESRLPILSAYLQVADRQTPVRVRAWPETGRWSLEAELRVEAPELWWPHTHGLPALHPCLVRLTTAEGVHDLDCGNIGFCRLETDREHGLAIRVNGTPIYCRGACWTVGDIVDPGNDDTLEHDLRLARDAGINMLRVGGTMVYPGDRFYELCDQLGILVWQDFMFANMDYPLGDPAFLANIEAEAREQIARLMAHPSLAVLCGNSEVEQQAAMVGAPREIWRHSWFGDRLPAICAEYRADVAYVPSTPSGGVLPFHVAEGIAHYYGVGAYRQLPSELRQADVKFAAECLGFSNIPEPETVTALTGALVPAPHHPRWKERVPRDAGAGWDFEDVRDFYVGHLFAVDPAKLRSFDLPRYLQLGRVAPGEMMSQVLAEWRGGHSQNQGGLVWFYKDLWPGAGWGILDSMGLPKATYYQLKRCWQPRQLTITDEGLDGLHLHAINESAQPFRGFVELLLLQDGHIVKARGESPCEISPRGRMMFSADALLGGFFDVTYAYRFGPPGHDLAIATLRDEQRSPISQAVYFVQRQDPRFVTDAKIDCLVASCERGYEVRLSSNRFLQSVRVEAPGFLPDDSYFHVLPGRPKAVRFTPWKDRGVRFRVMVEALNLPHPLGPFQEARG